MLFLALLAVSTFGREPRIALASHLCPDTGSPFGPFALQTYEDGNYRTTYARTLELAGFNALFPQISSFALHRVETGPRSAGSSQTANPYVPPVLLKSIAWLESGWAQADYSVPYGALGAVLASHDCGYGIMQVTTGMQNVSGVPNLDQAMIGGHYAFNIARGARILVDKWNLAPEYRPMVGSRDAAIIEDWYYALWGYNGFAFKNHPLNPAYSATRVPYSCGPVGDGFGHDRSQYPYQELVLGCLARPPYRSSVALWNPQPVHLPNLSDPAFAGPLNLNNWTPCSYSLQCAPMDMPTPNTNNRDSTALTVTRAQVIGSPSLRLSASSLNLIAIPPVQTGSANLSISNSGSGVLTWRLTSNAAWLKVSRVQGVALGSDLGGTASAVTVTADTRNLPPGTYKGQLTVESLGTSGAPAGIPVTVSNYPDGTLLTDSGPAIYMINGGLKRHIPNAVTFEAYNLNWSSVLTIPDSALSALPAGDPLLNVLSDGFLLKGSGPDIFVMENRQKRPVSPAVFTSCQYGSDAVYTISDLRLNGVSTGEPLSGPRCPSLSLPDQTLIKGTGPTVYVMRKGLKRHLANAFTFEAMGYKWANVNQIADSALNAVPTGHNVLDLLGSGSLIKGSAPDVYVMENGFKRHAVNIQTFLACGYGFDAVITVVDQRLQSVPTGTPLSLSCPKPSFANGTLLKGSTADVWVMQGGLRRWAVSAEVFLSCGHKWGNINQIADSTLNAVSQGPPLTPCIPEGTLIRGSQPDVYIMQGGLRRHLVSAGNFLARGYNWSDLVLISDILLGHIPAGHPLLDVLATGNLIKGSESDVYVMENGRKRHAVNKTTFLACGYYWDALRVVPDSLLNSLPTGPSLTTNSCPRPSFVDGTLLAGSSPTVWVVEGGKRRWAVSTEVFLSCGHKWGNINRIADSTLNAIIEGSPLSPC